MLAASGYPTKPMHILVVEDDPQLARAVAAGLSQNGWRSDHAPDAAAARIALVDHAYDAVLLDLALPGGSGLEVLRALRARHDATPVVIVTARDALSDRIEGLDAGADDYVVKPFQFDELYARLRALARRTNGRVAPVLRCGAVELDPVRRVVTRDGVVATLSIHEYRTLLALMERQGRIVTREQLEDLVYGGDGAIQSNTIAVYVHQLRRKLGDELIATLRGYGYCLGERRA
jgi:two-component system OmpR family response regulator